MQIHRSSRRTFLRAAGAAAIAPALLAAGRPRAAEGSRIDLRKAVKYGMVREDLPIADKFKLLRDLDFQGVEMDSPADIDRDAVVEARDESGIDIHGVVCSTHWQVRLSDPDPAVRGRAVENLRTAIADAHRYGATTVLLVPGRVADEENENFDQVWQRSQAGIREALPDAVRTEVKIAVEVVWNDFIQSPEQLVQYVDELDHPLVGAYFDASNVVTWGTPSADWIRALGERMLKFDFKGYSHEDGWVDIGEGDEDWPEVRRALLDVGYEGGWATAETHGGDRHELRRISRLMDQHVLGRDPDA